MFKSKKYLIYLYKITTNFGYGYYEIISPFFKMINRCRFCLTKLDTTKKCINPECQLGCGWIGHERKGDYSQGSECSRCGHKIPFLIR